MILRRLLFAFLTLSTSGCFQIAVHRDVASEPPVEIKQHLFFLGFMNDPVIDLTSQCPQGVAHFEEIFTPVDLLFTVVSVGIYSPRTVRIECESHT